MTRTNTVRRMFLGFLFLLVAAPVHSEQDPDKTLSPYFSIQGGDSSAGSFPLKSTDVRANVNGAIADVIVTQTYSNEGDRPINGRYVFPGSTRASVHGMTITVDDEVVVATIREREKARQEFEAAKSEGKSASLLQQERPNIFTMSVANIMPGEDVQVELHYTELIVPEEGIYEFVYPTVVAPRYSNQAEETAGESARWVRSPYLVSTNDAPAAFDIQVTLSTGLPLQDVECSSHPVEVAWDGRSVARINLADPADFGGNRDYILKYRLAGQEIQSGLSLHEGESEKFFLLMVQPPERVQASDIPPREYIFVLDVSGSMDGFPLDTAKSLIGDLLAHLRQTDQFNIVLFAGGSKVMAPTSVPASGENIAQAMQVIGQQRGGGGTELVGALEVALGFPSNDNVSRSIVVITDGFIAAEREAFEMISRNLGTTNVFAFGIGSSVNRYLLEGIARAGIGEPFIVTGPAEAAAEAARFRRYIESPVLTHLRISFRGFDAYDVEPMTLPNLFAQRPILLFGKWRGRRTGEIEVSGMRAAGPYVQTFRVNDTRPLEENSALGYLWARQRIARLSDFNTLQEDPDMVDQITSLGLTYSLLTRYTSFIAVVESVRNPAGDAADVNQTLPLPKSVSVLAIGGGYAAGPEPELWILFMLSALLITTCFLLRRGRRTV